MNELFGEHARVSLLSDKDSEGKPTDTIRIWLNDGQELRIVIDMAGEHPELSYAVIHQSAVGEKRLVAESSV